MRNEKSEQLICIDRYSYLQLLTANDVPILLPRGFGCRQMTDLLLTSPEFD
jgi:hypothetical protein